MIQCWYLYIFGGLDPAVHRAEIPSEEFTMTVIGCGSYEQAEQAALEMVRKGCPVIEVCPGFGHEGVARLQKAVGPEIPVGVVRFDLHPCIQNRSGDSVFAD